MNKQQKCNFFLCYVAVIPANFLKRFKFPRAHFSDNHTVIKLKRSNFVKIIVLPRYFSSNCPLKNFKLWKECKVKKGKVKGNYDTGIKNHRNT